MSQTVLSNYCQLLPFRRGETVILIEFLSSLAPLRGEEARCKFWLQGRSHLKLKLEVLIVSPPEHQLLEGAPCARK